MIFQLLYIGSFKVLKRVAAVGNLSLFRRMPTRWIVKDGFILVKPSGEGRSYDDVTNRSISLLEMQARITLRKIGIINP